MTPGSLLQPRARLGTAGTYAREVLLMLVLAAATPALAAAPADPAVIATCSACHGAQGEGNAALFAPRLAGQRGDYLARQLRAFKSGARGTHPDDKHGTTMRAIATPINDALIDSLSSHFAQLPAVPLTTRPAGDTVAGKAVYDGTCSACHGPRGEGFDQLQSANLQILGADYLRRQMEAYVKGWRGAGPNADQAAIWMRSIASQLGTPAELDNVTVYLQSLGMR